MTAPASMILFCRAGFEKECAAEISTRASEIGVALWCKTKEGDGVVFANSGDGAPLDALFVELRFDELIFVRDWFLAHEVSDMQAGDRVDPLLDALVLDAYNGLWVTHADTTEGRTLSKLCRQLTGRLEGGLKSRAKYRPSVTMRAQIMLVDGGNAWVGHAPSANAAPWPMGVPRLKLGGAPSRSAAKLEEAFIWFLGDHAEALLRPGMSAADLGAAPGGWTWQFVRRSIRVVAVDHGALRDDLMMSGLVDHCREDAFRFKPNSPLDWLVCDIVDKPSRVTSRILLWLQSGWCRFAIFNLKLPMNKRFAEVERLLFELSAAQSWSFSAKQLYHDREEITVFAHRGKY